MGERFTAERKKAKAINFAIVYGQEAATLGEDLDIETHEAELLMESWYKSKPEVKKWKIATVRESSREPHVALSVLGRWRTLPLLRGDVAMQWRRRSERAAVNFAIQGSAADVVLAAM